MESKKAVSAPQPGRKHYVSEKKEDMVLISTLLLLSFLMLQGVQPSALHAEVQHEALAPQGNFIPEDPAFKAVADAYKGLNLRKALEETERLNRHHKKPKIAEAAAFLMGDLYLVMSERGRPLLFRKALDAYQEAHFRYPESKRTLPTLMKMGMIFSKEKLFYEALATFDRIITKYPRSLYVIPARINKGDVFLQWGKYEKAIQAFDEINPAILSAQENTFLLLNYAETYYLMDKHETAFGYYKLVSPQDPILQISKKALYQYGISAYESGVYTQARELLFILHNKYPKSTYSLLALARIGDSLRLQGKRVRAKKIYQQVHAATGRNHHHKSANLIAALGEFHLAGCDLVHAKSQPHCFKGRALGTESGRIAYEKIKTSSDILLHKIKNRPDFIDRLIFETATALEQHGIFSESLKIKDDLVAQKISKPLKKTIQKSLPQTAISAVNQLLEKRENIAALNIYYSNQDYFSEQIIQGETGLNLGIALAESGLYQETIDFLAPLVRRTHKTTSEQQQKAFFYLIRTYYKQARYVDAETQRQAFIKRYPKSTKIPHLQHLSAKASLAQGKTPLAIKKLKLWLAQYAKSPERPLVYVSLGDAYTQQGKLEQALESYLKVDEKERKNTPGLYLRIADTFFKRKNYKRSIAFYAKTITSSKEDKALSWATFQMAQSYEKLGMKDKGQAIYSQLETSSQGLIRALSEQKAVELAPQTEANAAP